MFVSREKGTVGIRLLSPETLAEACAVSRTWIYARVRSGEIPHLKLGHYVRFDQDEVLKWLASHRRGPLPSPPEMRQAPEEVEAG
jgi:excisionase family DNA binding protein